MYPNLLLFQKSHALLSEYMEYRFQEREVQRLIDQLLFHTYAGAELEESCFILEKWDRNWVQEDLKKLEKEKLKQGKILFFSCIFWRQEKKLVNNIFFLSFDSNSLYLGEYKNGIFLLGSRILLLTNVDGFFEKKGIFLKFHYWRMGEKEKREVVYEWKNPK